MLFPDYRPRRMRMNENLRRMVRETQLDVDDLILPLFAVEGKNVKNPIPSMPGQFQLSINHIVETAAQARELGIPAIILFGLPPRKDPLATQAYAKDGVVQRAVKAVKDKVPDLTVITDVCLCAYTDHGHCGVVEGHTIDNDASLDLLARTALSHAKAGADMVAPSDMMDGRVAEIREALDEENFSHIPIMSYAAKYCSAYYGPFREAADSAPQFGDRRTYQMDPANAREALREVSMDAEEGADIVMVKPALAYLDIICRIKEEFDLPVAAYNVSGEYAMIKAAAERGWLDGPKVMLETLTAIKRAGADMILTYFALEAAQLLNAPLVIIQHWPNELNMHHHPSHTYAWPDAPSERNRPENALRLVAWETTRNCNLSCVHCRASATCGPYTGELDTQAAFRLLDQIAEVGKPIVILTGGEPLLRADIFDIAGYGTDKGLRMVMAVNGMLVTEQMAEKMAQAGIQRISISLDGADRRRVMMHFAVWRAPSKGALRGIANAKAAGIAFQINTTITKSNLKQIPSILKLAEQLGAVAHHIFLLVPTGRGKYILDQAIDAREYEETLNWFYDQRNKTSLQLKATCAPHYHRILRQRAKAEGQAVSFQTHGLDAVTRGCLAGSGFCFISHQGIVQPCGFSGFKLRRCHEAILRGHLAKIP